MIEVTRLNGSKLTVNALLIETLEATPDTVISFTTGNKLVVRENIGEIRSQVIDYLRNLGVVALTNHRSRMEGTEEW